MGDRRLSHLPSRLPAAAGSMEPKGHYVDCVFISRGSGYADDHSFDPYEELRVPLPRREQRILISRTSPVSYEAYRIAYAKERASRDTYWMYLLISHGGGTQILKVTFPKVLHDLVLTHPDEQLVFALLYEVFDTANRAAQYAAKETAQTYSNAFVEGRLKKSRIAQGRRRVFIEPRTELPMSTTCLPAAAGSAP
jgi:hypothetical protein